jgi:hypothetical protein
MRTREPKRVAKSLMLVAAVVSMTMLPKILFAETPGALRGATLSLDLSELESGRCSLGENDSFVSDRCSSYGVGGLEIHFSRLTEESGLIFLSTDQGIEFSQLSDGKIFFFHEVGAGQSSENSEQISVRNHFCVANGSAVYGYIWVGTYYEPNADLAEACPLAKVEE